MSTTVTPQTPQGNVPAIGVPNSQDYPRLVVTGPYYEQVALAEIIEPSVLEAVEGMLPGLVPPYVQGAANEAVQQLAVLLGGSTMTGPLYLSPVIPTQPSQAASMQYVDLMLATAGIPEVPSVPAGQVWAREVGQWVPISQTEGTFLPLSGGTMQGAINMSGNTITNLAALPVMPNGAAPAQWVLNQIAASSLYQGTWVPDTNTPDLTQPATHQNGFTWIVTTSTVGGVVVSQPIPGLQGQTVFNGDTVIYSATAGAFQIIHGGGLSLEEAQALFLPLAGGQMSGALLLNANATSAMQAVTLQQLQGATSPVGEAPNDGQIYGRNGLSASWAPVLPLGGGILTGPLSLAANANTALQAVPLQQLNSSVANYVPLAGGVTITGPLTMGSAATLTLGGNAAANLQPVPLQQMTSVLAAYAPTNAPTINQPVLMGVTNGAAAIAGQVGEYQEANLPSAATIVSDDVWTPIITLSLPAGDWDVWGAAQISTNVGTVGLASNMGICVNITGETLGVGLFTANVNGSAVFNYLNSGTAPRQLLLSAATTVTLSCIVDAPGYSKTVQFATIRARRVR